MGLAFGLAYLLRFEFAVPLEIVHGKRSVTAHTALPPARLFGTSERSG